MPKPRKASTSKRPTARLKLPDPEEALLAPVSGPACRSATAATKVPGTWSVIAADGRGQ